MAAVSMRPHRLTAAIAAVALLLGGMPLTLGIVIHSSEAMFTLDVCHPVQSFGHSPVPFAAPVPAAPEMDAALPERECYAARPIVLRDRSAEAPDPPPPRTLA